MVAHRIAAPSVAPPVEGMFRALLWVHTHLRQEFQTVHRLVDAVRDGRSRNDPGRGPGRWGRRNVE